MESFDPIQKNSSESIIVEADTRATLTIPTMQLEITPNPETNEQLTQHRATGRAIGSVALEHSITTLDRIADHAKQATRRAYFNVKDGLRFGKEKAVETAQSTHIAIVGLRRTLLQKRKQHTEQKVAKLESEAMKVAELSSKINKTRKLKRANGLVYKAQLVGGRRQYNARRIWGDEIGTDEFISKVWSESHNPLRAFSAYKASRKYSRNAAKINDMYATAKSLKSVNESTKKTTVKKNKALAKVENLSQHVSQLDRRQEALRSKNTETQKQHTAAREEAGKTRSAALHPVKPGYSWREQSVKREIVGIDSQDRYIVDDLRGKGRVVARHFISSDDLETYLKKQGRRV